MFVVRVPRGGDQILEHLPIVHYGRIDDHPANIEAAQALGWQAVLFTNATEARQALAALGVESVR